MAMRQRPQMSGGRCEADAGGLLDAYIARARDERHATVERRRAAEVRRAVEELRRRLAPLLAPTAHACSASHCRPTNLQMLERRDGAPGRDPARHHAARGGGYRAWDPARDVFVCRRGVAHVCGGHEALARCPPGTVPCRIVETDGALSHEGIGGEAATPTDASNGAGGGVRVCQLTGRHHGISQRGLPRDHVLHRISRGTVSSRQQRASRERQRSDGQAAALRLAAAGGDASLDAVGAASRLPADGLPHRGAPAQALPDSAAPAATGGGERQTRDAERKKAPKSSKSKKKKRRRREGSECARLASAEEAQEWLARWHVEDQPQRIDRRRRMLASLLRRLLDDTVVRQRLRRQEERRSLENRARTLMAARRRARAAGRRPPTLYEAWWAFLQETRRRSRLPPNAALQTHAGGPTACGSGGGGDALAAYREYLAELLLAHWRLYIKSPLLAGTSPSDRLFEQHALAALYTMRAQGLHWAGRPVLPVQSYLQAKLVPENQVGALLSKESRARRRPRSRADQIRHHRSALDSYGGHAPLAALDAALQGSPAVRRRLLG